MADSEQLLKSVGIVRETAESQRHRVTAGGAGDDPYELGLANGLIFALSLLDGVAFEGIAYPKVA